MVERLIHTVLVEGLGDKQYSQELCKTWTEQIGDTIKTKLKGEISFCGPLTLTVATDVGLMAELNLERYKYVVQVVIGEQRGEGVK